MQEIPQLPTAAGNSPLLFTPNVRPDAPVNVIIGTLIIKRICISKLVVFFVKNHLDMVAESLKRYADPNDHNRIFYHQKNDDMEAIIHTSRHAGRYALPALFLPSGTNNAWIPANW